MLFNHAQRVWCISPPVPGLSPCAGSLGAAQLLVVRGAGSCQLLKTAKDSPLLRGMKLVMKSEPFLAFPHLVKTLDNVPLQG